MTGYRRVDQSCFPPYRCLTQGDFPTVMQDAPLLFAQRLIGAVTNAQRSGAIDIWLPTLAVKRSEPRPCVEPRAFLHRVRGRSSFDQFSTRFICVATGSCSVALNIRKLGPAHGEKILSGPSFGARDASHRFFRIAVQLTTSLRAGFSCSPGAINRNRVPSGETS